jgi:hypothetical protein
MKTLATIGVLALSLAVASPSLAAKSKKHKKAKKTTAAAMHTTAKHSKGGVMKSTGNAQSATVQMSGSQDGANAGASAHVTKRHSTGGVVKSTGK